MKWIAIVAGGLMLVVAGIAAIGSLLPRSHKASRTLRLTRPPADVWPVLIQATEASDVPVDVLERDPPRRLVTRVTEKEKNFGGTWTITIAPTPSGSDSHDHRRRLGREPDLPVRVALPHRPSRDDGRDAETAREDAERGASAVRPVTTILRVYLD